MTASTTGRGCPATRAPIRHDEANSDAVFPSGARVFGRYARHARVPREEVRDGVRVLHPRYATVPGVGMYVTPWTLFHAARAAIDRLRAQGVDRLHSRKLRSFAEVAFQ